MLGSLALAPAHAVAAEAGARLETFELPTRRVDPSTPGGTLEDGRTVPKVHVLLPDGYDDHPDRRYPVLWLLHGANGGTDTWIPGIETLAKDLPAIVVMPDGGRFGMYTDWWNDGTRGDPAWASYHLENVRNEVQRRYRIRPGRRWHAIAGISMGGQGSLRYAAMLPGYFGSVATFSAALPDMQSDAAHAGLSALAPDDGPRRADYEAIFGAPDSAYAEANNPTALVANYAATRMYMTSGDGTNCPQDPHGATYTLDQATETVLNSQQAPFAAAAEAAGADVTAVTTCGVHTFGVWDRAFADARKWGFFEAPAKQPQTWTYRTGGVRGHMWGLRFRFDEPPAAVVDFARDGRTLTATGMGHVRITGRPGCELSADLPFTRDLPRACFGRSG